MSRRDPQLTLAQIRDAAEKARALCANHTLDSLLADWTATAALERCIEIVGEGVRRLPPELKQQRDDIPWKDIAGTRDRLIHGYDLVDHRVLLHRRVVGRLRFSPIPGCGRGSADIGRVERGQVLDVPGPKARSGEKCRLESAAMLTAILRRVLLVIPNIVLLTALLFWSVFSLLGTPVEMMLGRDADPATIEALNARYGFDRPVYEST